MGLQKSHVPCWIFPGSGAWALAVNIKKNIPIALVSAQPAPEPVTSHRHGELGFWQASLSPYLCLLQCHLQWVLRGGESQEMTGAACPRHSSFSCFNGQHRCFNSTQLKNPGLEKKCSFLNFQPALALSKLSWQPPNLFVPTRTPCSPIQSHKQGAVCGCGTWKPADFARAPKRVTSHIVIPTPFTALATYIVKALQPHFWSKLITATKSPVVFLCFCCPPLELWMCHGDRSPALLGAQPCSSPARSSHSIVSEQWHRFPTALLWEQACIVSYWLYLLYLDLTSWPRVCWTPMSPCRSPCNGICMCF